MKFAEGAIKIHHAERTTLKYVAIPAPQAPKRIVQARSKHDSWAFVSFVVALAPQAPKFIVQEQARFVGIRVIRGDSRAAGAEACRASTIRIIRGQPLLITYKLPFILFRSC